MTIHDIGFASNLQTFCPACEEWVTVSATRDFYGTEYAQCLECDHEWTLGD